MKEMKEVMTMTEAAEALGVDRRTILRWIGKGYLKALTYPSGNHRLAKKDIEDFLAKHGRLAQKTHRIVVVDDDPVMLEVVRSILDTLDLSLEIRTCANELEALMVLGDFKPDLILIDYKLPHVDGLTISTKIRQNHALANTPIVMISGAIHDVAIKEHGIQAFLRKPFGIRDIEKVVKEALRLQEAA